MPDLSVILCTHNPRAAFLERTLQGLREQSLPLERWEFLLVDNASTETLDSAWDLAWHPHARHVREDELGLTPARLRGIRDAAGTRLVFIDDDNVLAPDFLEIAATLFDSRPDLGAFGAGMLKPEFEITPPPHVVPHLRMLALRSVEAGRWSSNPRDHECIPWGAGLCVTREVAEHFCTLVDRLRISGVLGRKGTALFAGEDDVFSWASTALGRGFGIFPELRITHLIPAGRLRPDYLLRLAHDHAFSHGILGWLLDGTRPPNRGRLGALRTLLHGCRRGLFSMRYQRAIHRGAASAHRFIDQHELRRIELTPGKLAETPASTTDRHVHP